MRRRGAASAWYARYGLRTIATAQTEPAHAILPTAEEAAELVPPRDGVTWRVAGDARLLGSSGYALMLQVAHPVVGQGVSDFSNFREDPWGRLLRTLDYTSCSVYGGPELARTTGARVREMHKSIKGVLPNGERYHSLEPTAYAWVHATLADAMVRATDHFVGRLSWPEQRTLWREWKKLGRFVGVRDRDLPDDWDDFNAYFDGVVERLERTRSVDDVLEAMAKPPPPQVKGMSDALWRAVRAPAARGGRLATIGLLPQNLRDRLGLELTKAEELEFRASGAASRASGPLLPKQLKAFGPRYLRWRIDAIRRGEVASGRGTRVRGVAASA